MNMSKTERNILRKEILYDLINNHLVTRKHELLSDVFCIEKTLKKNNCRVFKEIVERDFDFIEEKYFSIDIDFNELYIFTKISQYFILDGRINKKTIYYT